LLFKAALDDYSSNVWYGTVKIHKGASQSEASQSSRNLLLSDHAKAAPIPVLEIEAYDVLRCSHGATAGPVDPDQLFYLESRGVPPEEAEALLIEAFFHEVVDRVPNDTFREMVMEDITNKIGAQG
jgi:Fe-S cluster assembly protein SufD